MTNMDNQKEGVEKRIYEVSFLVRAESDVEHLRRLFLQHSADTIHDGGVKKIVPAHKITNDEILFFGFFHISAMPSEAKFLERDLGLTKEVLRSLIVSSPKGKGGETIGSASRRAATYSRERRENQVDRPRTEERQPRRPDVLSNEALEKKIEEILQ